MVAFSVKVDLPKEDLAKIGPNQVRPFLRRTVARASAQALRTARLLAPVNEGRLRGTIHEVVEGDLTRIVSPGVRYGVWVELGRAAGERPPPPLALLSWVKGHPALIAKILKGRRETESAILGVAYIIARSIGRKGITPRPFMAPAQAAALVVVDAELAKLRLR